MATQKSADQIFTEQRQSAEVTKIKTMLTDMVDNGIDAMTAEDKAFLKARRHYLTAAQREYVAELLAPPKEEKKAEEKKTAKK